MTDRLFGTEGDDHQPGLRGRADTSDQRQITLDEMSEEGDQPGFWSVLRDRQQVENAIGPTFNRIGEMDHTVDPTFDDPTFDQLQERLKERDIDPDEVPAHMFGELGSARNARELERKLDRIQERIESRQQLEQLGGAKAIGAELGSFLLDPAAVAVDVAVGGASKGRLVHRLLSGGFRATVAHGAIEAALSADRELPEPQNIALGFAASFILGAGAGGAFGARPVSHADQAVSRGMDGMTVSEAANAAVTGDIPRARFDNDLQEWVPVDQPHGAVGADRADLFPDRPDHLNTPAGDRLREVSAGVPDDAGLGLRLRFDLAGQMLRSNSSLVRRMGNMLVSQPVRRDRDAVRQTARSERARAIWGGADRVRANDAENAFLQHLKKNTGKGQFRSWFAHEEREAFFQEVGRYMRSRGQREASEEVKKAAAAHQMFFKQLLDQMKRSGVRGADQVSADMWYTPRVLSKRNTNRIVNRMRALDADDGAVARQLEDAFEGALRSGRRKAGLDIDDDLTRLVARAYARRALGVEDQNVPPHSLSEIEGFDLEDLGDLTEFLAEHLDADEFQRASGLLNAAEEAMQRQDRVARDADTPARLKRRLTLDEDFEFEVNLGQGRSDTIRIADFFEDNVEELAFNYGRFASGESSLAEVGTSSTEVRRAVQDLRREADTREGDPDAFPELATHGDADMVDFALRAVMGQRPDNMSENARRLANIMKSAGFITKMGSAFVNAIAESMTMLAMAGPGRVLRNMDKYMDVLRAASGKNPDKAIVRQAIMLSGGLGGSWVRNIRGRRMELDATGKARGAMGKVEDFMEGAKRTASWANLLARTTDVTRDMTAVNALSQLDDILVRGMRAPGWFNRRRKSWGMSDQRMERLREYLSSNAVRRDPNSGALLDLGKMPPDVRLGMEDYVFRYVSEAIQEIDRGNLPRFMQHPVGSMIFQFRSFESASYVRHTLQDLNMRDSLGLQKFVFSGAMAGLLYLGRMHFFFAGDPDKIEERATPEMAIRTGMSYAVNIGVLPLAIDTVSEVALGEPLINPFGRRTSGVASGLQLDPESMAPSLTLLDDIKTLAGVPFRNLRGEGARGLDQNEMRSVFSIMGLETMWFGRPVKNAAIRSRPPREQGDSVNLWETIGIADE